MPAFVPLTVASAAGARMVVECVFRAVEPRDAFVRLVEAAGGAPGLTAFLARLACRL